MSIARCPHCGTANRAGSNFCNGCGTDLREGEGRRSAPRAAQPVSPAPPPALPSSPSPAPAQEPDTREASAPPAPSAPEPWLHLDFATGESSPTAGNPEDPFHDDGTRLITGVQGLLTPIRIATNIGDDDPLPAPSVPTGGAMPAASELRRLRDVLGARPKLTATAPHPFARPPRGLHNPWFFVAAALLLFLPAFWLGDGPPAQPARLPGVVETYTTIHNLPADLPVLVYWAYDPAGAGELDLVMQPVLRHLLLRRARLFILSPLPGGPATAQRLAERVRTGPRPTDLSLAANLALPIRTAYVPGGAAILPLVARNPGLVGAAEDPALVVVVAAQAEEVQHWLEQVQPLLPTPVVAVSAAGADPILRPYRDSGQLAGLVSGFDGAAAYWRLLEPTAPEDANPALNRHLGLQNWGHLALLLAIVLGNLAALVGRDTGA